MRLLSQVKHQTIANHSKTKMKKTILTVGLVFAAISGFAQANDPVVMTVNGKPVTRSEFEYSFNKNNSEGVVDKKELDAYVPLFVNFKMKVAAAIDAGYDTLTSVRNDLKSYREQMLLPTITDPDFVEQQAILTYQNTAARFEGQDMLTASHILVLMRQDASNAEQASAKARIDSIYQVLVGGADFAEVARSCSDDKGSAEKGGSLGQFGKGMMIPDFENAAYQLQPGQMSTPFKSTVGWHIIKLEDRHPFEPYEFHRESIIKFLESRGIQQAAANHYVDSMANLRGISRDEFIDEKFSEMIANDEEQKFLSQEYYEGTLMYEIVKNEIWEPAEKDEAGQASFYSKNKKKYAWDSPRFKGIIIRAKDKDIVDKAKLLIRKEKDDSKWGRMIVEKFNTDSVKVVRIEHGIFKEGDNKNIDIMQFGKDGQCSALKDFPVTDSYGRMLKKPESFRDVKAQVSADYQTAKEQEWVEELRRKYSYTVNEDVLRTVNNH